MPREAASALQLPLLVSESSVAQDVLTRYEAIRPVLTGLGVAKGKILAR